MCKAKHLAQRFMPESCYHLSSFFHFIKSDLLSTTTDVNFVNVPWGIWVLSFKNH